MKAHGNRIVGLVGWALAKEPRASEKAEQHQGKRKALAGGNDSCPSSKRPIFCPWQIHLRQNIYRTSITVNPKSNERRYIRPVNRHGQELFYGLIRLHVLLHAAHESIYGLAMIKELEHHGYQIGPGTLYPLLHGLERSGLLRSVSENVERRKRRVYKITPAGRKALEKARGKVDELYEEFHEERPRRLSANH
jgi:DNA-binding PadR family transcriptional regulator